MLGRSTTAPGNVYATAHVPTGKGGSFCRGKEALDKEVKGKNGVGGGKFKQPFGAIESGKGRRKESRKICKYQNPRSPGTGAVGALKEYDGRVELVTENKGCQDSQPQQEEGGRLDEQPNSQGVGSAVAPKLQRLPP